jgi:hypothetical protein
MTAFARFILALLSIFLSNPALSEEFRVHPSGFGPARMGMPVEQASTLLGTPLIKLPGTYQDYRYVVYPKHGFKGISFGVSAEGVITNVYVAYDAKNIRTNVGLHVGSPAQDLRRLYGEQIEVKAYQCANAFLIYTYRQPGAGNYGIVYTVSESGKVEGIMSGDLQAEVPPC